ncbi:MAG: IS66 family insertion sequence element accessory protein TnpA [Victivallales bacterium]
MNDFNGLFHVLASCMPSEPHLDLSLPHAIFFFNPEPEEDDMGREGRDYWEEQLSEYWDSGLTIQEYSELKELPYESTRRWIRVLQKARQDEAIGSSSLELVEVKSLQTDARNGSGIRLLVDGIEIAVAKGFDDATLSEVLNLLKARSCSSSAAR